MSIGPKSPDRATVVQRLHELAQRLGRTPKRDEFCRESGVSNRGYLRHFSGYRAFVRAAGLDHRKLVRQYSDDDLLRVLRDGLVAAGGIVGQKRYAVFGPHHMTIRRRWRGWDKALVALCRWLEQQEPDFVYLDLLRQYCKAHERMSAEPPSPRCGELIRFRALDHAPTSESAVIFLFGLMAEELGFVVETVGASFPDAYARRRIGNAWRRVRIEFEHESRNFREHGHDARGCDLVICWKHNWPECPVEVLELKRVIATLGKVPARDTRRCCSAQQASFD